MMTSEKLSPDPRRRRSWLTTWGLSQMWTSPLAPLSLVVDDPALARRRGALGRHGVTGACGDPPPDPWPFLSVYGLGNTNENFLPPPP